MMPQRLLRRAAAQARLKMFKILRMVCAIIAAVAIALCVPAGIFWDMIAVWACLGGALLFFALSMLFKFLQEDRDKKDPPEETAENDDTDK